MSTADQSGHASRERSPQSEPGWREGAWNEEQVERLLTRFFAREVPASLRAASPRPALRQPALSQPALSQPALAAAGPAEPIRSAAAGSRAGVFGLVAAALVVLGAGLLLYTSSDEPGSSGLARRARGVRLSGPGVANPVAGTKGAGTNGAVAKGTVPDDLPVVVVPSGNGRVEYSVTERDEPLETRYLDTEHGPVEQRARRRITNVSVIDPESGNKVEVEIPEVTVEIFPIDK